MGQTQTYGGVKPISKMFILIKNINGLPMTAQYMNGYEKKV